MMHKRKLIKKVRSNHKSNSHTEERQIESHQSLFQKLKSINPSHKQQAITILANLHLVVPQLTRPQFIRELINVLYQTNNTIVYETLFAIANLCQIQNSLIQKLFQNGLDKALVQLSSTDKQLLKPILIFFITIADNLPPKYQYLLKGVQNSLSRQHLKMNTQLCLQFLFRTINLPSSDFQLSEQMIKQIALIFSSTYNVNQKSYAVAVLAQSLQKQSKWNGQMEQILTNYMTQMLVCTDLQKQYKMNFQEHQQKKQKQHQLQMQQHDQNQDQDQMQEEQQTNKKSLPTDKQARKQQLNKKKQKLKFFMNTIQGTQILLQFLLDVLQSSDCSSDEQSDQEQVQQFGDEGMQQPNNKVQPKNSSLRQLILSFIRQNMAVFPKFLCLSSTVVPQTQNIVYLFYHLLMHIDKQLGLSSSSSQQNQVQINQLIQMSLQNLFNSIQQHGKTQQKNISLEQYEILVQCIQIGLKVLLKNKSVGVKQDFLIQFSKRFMLQNQIFKSIKIVEQIKPSWLVMLQLYSKVLNPQKNKNVTAQQNYEVGQILKHLIVSIPHTELEQFRCQVLDTLFDIYSNEMFDKAFVELGFFSLLQAIAKQSPSSNSKKGNKTNKFVVDVLKDVKRFLQYKYKKIKQ